MLASKLAFCYYLDMNKKKSSSTGAKDSNKKASNSANAHDKRYKRLFSNPLIVEELMNCFVDIDFVNELDYSTLELQEKSFINEEHKHSEADMIWKINFQGNDVFIYLLIEFQSKVDKYMALRFGSYIFDFYKWLSKRKDINDLPAVFPILIYNGDERWTAKDNIKDLIIGSIPPEYIPNFSYYKIIENEIPRDKLLRIHNALSMVFYVENSSVEDVVESINEIYEILKDELPELIKEFSTWLTNLFVTSGYDMGNLEDEIDNLKDPMEVRTMFSATLEKYKEKCKLEGMREGRLEGKIEDAKEMLRLGIAINIIAQVTGLSYEFIEELKVNE